MDLYRVSGNQSWIKFNFLFLNIPPFFPLTFSLSSSLFPKIPHPLLDNLMCLYSRLPYAISVDKHSLPPQIAIPLNKSHHRRQPLSSQIWLLGERGTLESCASPPPEGKLDHTPLRTDQAKLSPDGKFFVPFSRSF